MEPQITARIAALETERDNFIQEANKQIFAYNVAINELKKLIAPPTPLAPVAEAPAESTA